MTAGGPVQMAIIGAGFAGIGMACELRCRGIDDFVVFERAGDVAGTRRDNTYPVVPCGGDYTAAALVAGAGPLIQPRWPAVPACRTSTARCSTRPAETTTSTSRAGGWP